MQISLQPYYLIFRELCQIFCIFSMKLLLIQVPIKMSLMDRYIPGLGVTGNRPVTLCPRTVSSSSVSVSSHRITLLRIIFSMTVNCTLPSIGESCLTVRFETTKSALAVSADFAVHDITPKADSDGGWQTAS